MKFARRALVVYEEIKSIVESETYDRVIESAEACARKNGCNQLNYIHLEHALRVVVGDDFADRHITTGEDRYRAGLKVAWAVNNGIIPKISSCQCAMEHCTKAARAYHHWSYAKDHLLSVIPVCALCHSDIHRKIIVLDDPIKSTIQLVAKDEKNRRT